MLTYSSRPGFRAWWEVRRAVFSEPFASFLESQPPDPRVVSCHEVTHLGAP